LGVSTDSAEKQKAFKEAQKLPYTLIADVDGKVMDAFKVKQAIPLIKLAAREAFIIKEGKIVWHDPSASTTQQAQDIKAALEKLK
jgi:thioredoxin-dependent peroxiredoxin